MYFTGLPTIDCIPLHCIFKVKVNFFVTLSFLIIRFLNFLGVNFIPFPICCELPYSEYEAYVYNVPSQFLTFFGFRLVHNNVEELSLLVNAVCSHKYLPALAKTLLNLHCYCCLSNQLCYCVIALVCSRHLGNLVTPPLCTEISMQPLFITNGVGFLVITANRFISLP